MRAYIFTFTALVCAGCPGREVGEEESSGGLTEAEGTGTPTTGVPEDSVIAPVIASFRPLGAAPVEQAVDPFKKFADISILAAGQVIPGIYDGSTRVEFAGVPAGEYSLRQQFPPYPTLPGIPGVVSEVVTDERELGVYAATYSGRADVGLSYDLDTRVVLTAIGLQPLGPGDQFELYSHQADALAYLYPSLDDLDGSNSPIPGAVSLDGWNVAWRPDTTRNAWPLPDPGQGDDLWLAQLQAGVLVDTPDAVQAQDPWSYAETTTLVAAATLSSSAIVAGEVTLIDGKFAPVAAKTASFDLRIDSFMARLMLGAGSLVGTSCLASVVLEPGIDAPIVGVTPTLGSLDVFSTWVPPDPDCEGPICEETYVYPGDRVFDLAYADPYPGGTELAQVTCSLTSYVVHPVTGDDELLTASMTVVGRVGELTKAPVVPRLDVVGAVQVNGMTMAPDELYTGVGATPTVSFTAPTYGVADYYSVAVIQLDDITDVDGGLLRARNIGAVRTRNTSVTIPPGMMQAGSYYFLRVTAIHGYKLTSPGAYTHDLAYSSAVTGIITP